MPDPLPDPEVAARFLLDFLVAHHPALFAVDELTREFGSPSESRDMTRLYVTEGLIQLAAAGLINRVGDFVFASRTAVYAKRLEL
jgi:hypothetical protein